MNPVNLCSWALWERVEKARATKSRSCGSPAISVFATLAQQLLEKYSVPCPAICNIEKKPRHSSSSPLPLLNITTFDSCILADEDPCDEGIAGIFGARAFAYVRLVKLLPKPASRTDRTTLLWLVSDLNFEPAKPLLHTYS